MNRINPLLYVFGSLALISFCSVFLTPGRNASNSTVTFSIIVYVVIPSASKSSIAAHWICGRVARSIFVVAINARDDASHVGRENEPSSPTKSEANAFMKVEREIFVLARDKVF